MPTPCNPWLHNIQPTQPPPTSNRKQATWEHDKRPSIWVLFEQKNLDICSGAAGYISSEEIFSFSNDKDPRPSNFLFQIARGSGLHSESALFLQKSVYHSGDFFKKRPLQGYNRTAQIIRAQVQKQAPKCLNFQTWAHIIPVVNRYNEGFQTNPFTTKIASFNITHHTLHFIST
jgi:hypothetical protein